MDELIPKLRALLEQKLGTAVAYVDRWATPEARAAVTGPVLVRGGYRPGGVWSGAETVDSITLEGAPLALTFRTTQNDDTGFYDEWVLEIDGAPDEDRAVYAELFHYRRLPPHHGGEGGIGTCVFTFNGVRGAF